MPDPRKSWHTERLEVGGECRKAELLLLVAVSGSASQTNFIQIHPEKDVTGFPGRDKAVQGREERVKVTAGQSLQKEASVCVVCVWF